MKEEDKLLLKKGAESLGILLGQSQVSLFEQYLKEMNIWRKRLNLVSRKSDREIILKDFLDSLEIANHIPTGCSLADFGSGAGLPGIPIKIIRPDLRVVLLDSARKKIFFLSHLLRVMDLPETQALWTGDNEAMAKVEDFDFVVARAFGSLEKIQDACGGLVKPGGTLLAMKGKKGKKELDEILPRLEESGWELTFTETMLLPILGHERMLIGMKKICST